MGYRQSSPWKVSISLPKVLILDFVQQSWNPNVFLVFPDINAKWIAGTQLAHRNFHGGTEQKSDCSSYCTWGCAFPREKWETSPHKQVSFEVLPSQVALMSWSRDTCLALTSFVWFQFYSINILLWILNPLINTAALQRASAEFLTLTTRDDNRFPQLMGFGISRCFQQFCCFLFL